MNFQTTIWSTPLRVLMVNPLTPASQLTITKMLSGIVFGKTQLLDLILLVYENQSNVAAEFSQELISCAFPCYNSIRVTSDLPILTDADVFVFMTDFPNPNHFDFENMGSDEEFDNLYLIIKIAASLGKPQPPKSPEKVVIKKYIKDVPKKKFKPIIVGDGLLVIDIVMTAAKTLPPEMFYCNTPLRSIAKTVLSDYLKLECNQLNHAYVWAANDQVFHAEIERPYLKHDKIIQETNCDWDAIGPEMLELLNMEHIQFNASWMKREFIEKMVQSAANNPYGCIHKAAEMSKSLRKIWKPLYLDDPMITYTSLGVISDGSLGTIKGVPYVLPLIINENSWTVNTIFEETSHLRHEIKRINKTAKQHHQQLVPYVKEFLEENVINKAFIPIAIDSESYDDSYNMYSDSSDVGDEFDN